MYSDASAIGIMEGAYFVSRQHLLEWLRNDFSLHLSKIEECGTGAVYLQIADAIFPSKVPMKKVKWGAKQVYDCLHNFKLLQGVFTDNGVTKVIDIGRLAKGGYQDNLEFLQWMKTFYDRHCSLQPGEYDAIERRRLGDTNGLPAWAALDTPASSTAAAGKLRMARGGGSLAKAPTTGGSSMGGLRGSTKNCDGLVSPAPSDASRKARPLSRQQVTASTAMTSCASRARSPTNSMNNKFDNKVGGARLGHANSMPSATDLKAKNAALMEALAKKDAEIQQLKEEWEKAEIESEFFYGKLRELEIMCSAEGCTGLSKEEIEKVLYREEGSPVDIVDGGNNTATATEVTSQTGSVLVNGIPAGA